MIVPVSIIQMEMKHEQTTLEPGLNLGDYHGTIANQLRPTSILNLDILK